MHLFHITPLLGGKSIALSEKCRAFARCAAFVFRFCVCLLNIVCTLFEWLVRVAKLQLILSNDSLLQLDGGVVSLSMEEIKRAYPNVRTLVGKSIYVKASVLTSSGRGLHAHF